MLNICFMLDLKAFRRYKKISQIEAAELLGCKQSFISQIESGRRGLPQDYFDILKEKFGDEINAYILKENAPVFANIISSETTKAPLIGQYAYAGYLSGFSDSEYMEAQPIYVASKKYSGGNYVAFEIRGDSMDDNTRRAICHGDIVMAKELRREYWSYKLHIPKVFVIVHKTEGITCKEIIDHNVETGEIVCHSWNTTHRDFSLNLADVMQLFYLKEIKRDVIG